MDEVKRKDLARIYNVMSLIVPRFKARMEEFLESPEHLDELCSRVRNFS
jgi:hypothetical protein